MEGEVVVVMFEGGDVGVTTSSRHWGVLDWELGRVRGWGPVGVVRIWDVSFGFGATDWKAWIGSASKNSWAKMKGVLLGSIGRSVELGHLNGLIRQNLLFGTNRMSSHHVTGTFEYLLVLRKPTSISSRGPFPQSNCFWASRKAGLASTR